jgi:hypothetical protein
MKQALTALHCNVERWLVPGAEYAVAKKQPLVNGMASAEDARASATELLAEDAEGEPACPGVVRNVLSQEVLLLRLA